MSLFLLYFLWLQSNLIEVRIFVFIQNHDFLLPNKIQTLLATKAKQCALSQYVHVSKIEISCRRKYEFFVKKFRTNYIPLFEI